MQCDQVTRGQTGKARIENHPIVPHILLHVHTAHGHASALTGVGSGVRIQTARLMEGIYPKLGRQFEAPGQHNATRAFKRAAKVGNSPTQLGNSPAKVGNSPAQVRAEQDGVPGDELPRHRQGRHEAQLCHPQNNRRPGDVPSDGGRRAPHVRPGGQAAFGAALLSLLERTGPPAHRPRAPCLPTPARRRRCVSASRTREPPHIPRRRNRRERRERR
eukprot:811874-Prorocentrum_minimum.AAC.3